MFFQAYNVHLLQTILISSCSLSCLEKQWCYTLFEKLKALVSTPDSMYAVVNTSNWIISFSKATWLIMNSDNDECLPYSWLYIISTKEQKVSGNIINQTGASFLLNTCLPNPSEAFNRTFNKFCNLSRIDD